MLPSRAPCTTGLAAVLGALGVLAFGWVAKAASPAFETIHVFSAAGDGNSPRASLVLDSSGVAYGTTLFGGATDNGTVYQLTPVAGTENWTESVIYSFGSGPDDGRDPAGSLIVGPGGVLYGTTYAGGTTNTGTVFQLTPVAGGAWTETILYSFAGRPDGDSPHAGLLMSASGVLYGTTAYGGTGTPCLSGCGTVFSLRPPAAPGGAWTETLLHSFTNSDGANPFASLIAGSGGLLYGTTANGGPSGLGVVFSVNASTGAFTVLHSFTGPADGANSYAALTLALGKLYGAARNGGASGLGTLFSLTTTGTFINAYSFTGPADGANPVAGLLRDGANLYGAASLGGTNGDGTLFRVDLEFTTFQVLHNFNGAMGSANPLATPVLAPSAALLGTTEPEQALVKTMPQFVSGGSDFLFCTVNPPACINGAAGPKR